MKYSEKNKPLVCMQTNNMCYKNTREMEVLGILWHSTAANNPYISRYVQPLETDENYEEMIKILGKNKYGNDWNHIDREAGLNFWIGKLADGSVAAVQTMPWNYRPWGCGSGKNGSCNNGWIQFEICEAALTDKAYFEAVYKEACEMTAYLCKMFNINPKGTVKVNNVNVPTILCHQDSYKLGMGSDHADIYHWFPKYGIDMDDVRNDVDKLLNPPKEENKVTTPNKYKIGDEVKVKKGSTWHNGKTISSWVFDSKMYVRGYNSNGVIISTVKTGDISGTIKEECLEPYKSSSTPPVKVEKPQEEVKPTTPKSAFELGDEVRIIEGATWSNGKTIPNWVFTSKLYVRDIRSNGDITVSTLKTGDVTGTVNPKYLAEYKNATTAKPGFIPYMIVVTASRLNVRAGASTNDKVLTTIKNGEKYTVVEEKNGWGKISKGWISLGYTKKV